MAELKPLYLIHGDDDAAIDRWRTRVRARAARENAPFEVFDAAAGPAKVAAAIPAMTLEPGRRYLVADGAEGWKAGDLEPLEAQLGDMPPDTVLVLLVRGRRGPAARLLKAVEAAEGDVRKCEAPKSWELPKWVVGRAREEGLSADIAAAKALIRTVGERQQHLARELEKLSVALHPETELTGERVAELSAGEIEGDVYALADAIIAGDPSAACSLTETFLSGDASPGSMLYRLVDLIREAHVAAELLHAGVGEKDVAKQLGGPQWRAKKAIGRAKSADRESLERALCRLADFEVSARGGDDLDEETAFTLAIGRAA